MNIALISENRVDTITGTSVYIEEISKNLAKIHNVFLFLPHRYNSKPKKDKYGRIIIYIDNKITKYFSGNRKRFLKNLEDILDDLHSKINFDIFHCLYGHYFHFLKKYNKPIYWTCHNVPPNENKPLFYSGTFLSKTLNKYFYWIIRKKHEYLIKNFEVKKIITPSIYVKKIF